MNNQTKNDVLLVIIVILIIIFAILSYLVLTKKELFQNANDSQPPSNECYYYPWGNSIEFCTNNCMNEKRIGLWDEDGTKCNDLICQEICGTCTNENSCQWISSWSTLEKEKMLKINKETTTLSKMIPRKLNISAISFPSSDESITGSFVEASPNSSVVIKIFWENYNDSNKYMIHYYNMLRSDNMIKVQSLESNNISEYELRGLSANTEYSIIMYAINKYGISEGSNILLIKT